MEFRFEGESVEGDENSYQRSCEDYKESEGDGILIICQLKLFCHFLYQMFIL